MDIQTNRPSQAANTPALERRIADLRHELSMTAATIGSTRDSRRFANTVNQLNNDIRQLRSDLRRAGCSSGSIVVYGGASDDVCLAIREDLHQAEAVDRGSLARNLHCRIERFDHGIAIRLFR